MEYELKYVVHNHRAFAAKRFIESVCQHDKEHHCATISSIYYDSDQMHCLDEKINSDYLKSKYRLRWYRDLVTGNLSDAAFAEAKYRTGAQRDKERCLVDLHPQDLNDMKLEDPRLLSLPHTLARAGIIANWHLFPTMLIRYNRLRYWEPRSESRISIDMDIQMPRANKRILPGATPARLQTAVIEVKGTNSSLPPSLQPIIKLGARKSSFSKYLGCYARAHNKTFFPR